MTKDKYSSNMTQAPGHFGIYGGRFVPEALIGALDELALAHEEASRDRKFQEELAELHRTYTGRPSIITEARVTRSIMFLVKHC
jgi:tryptophan synthase beta chain